MILVSKTEESVAKRLSQVLTMLLWGFLMTSTPKKLFEWSRFNADEPIKALLTTFTEWIAMQYIIYASLF